MTASSVDSPTPHEDEPAAPAPGTESATRSLSPNRRLMLGALGVVFGDIGTSPLYALRECFQGHQPIAVSMSNVLGVLSLIFWSLILIISIKYVAIVMRADNRGEGGVLALSTLLVAASRNWRIWSPVAAMGVFGAALFFGDGFITPAVSVLGAMEGLSVLSPQFGRLVVPAAVLILAGLFLVQKKGTGAVGRAFGPIILVWFTTLGLLGLRWIIAEPQVLYAFNPGYAVLFFMNNGWIAFVTLSSVFLAVTGGEALYADMGHFGRPPIRSAWFKIVLPSLMLNYLGQGALLLENPAAIENPFYRLVPAWALPPLIMIATAAAIIASQAVISGVFSVARQAINLGYLPRLRVLHSSEHEIGQVYLPSINMLLMIGTLLLVIGFRSSSALAGAYGIAVSSTMVIESVMVLLLLYTVHWRYRWLLMTVLTIAGLAEIMFFSANLLKFFAGGWLPVLVAIGTYLLMSTWHEGRRTLNWILSKQQISARDFLAKLEEDPPRRVPGTAVYMVGEASGIPRSLTQNLRFNGVLHERNLLLTFASAEVPSVPAEDHVTVQAIAPGLIRIIVRHGFMETPNIVSALRAAEDRGVEYRPDETIYVVGRENPIISSGLGMPVWRKRLFAIMGRNAQMAAIYFGVPEHRVVEIGSQVRL